MSALAGDSSLTLAEAARIMREATKDKSYQFLPLGQEVERYLRAHRRRFTATTMRDYEGRLALLATHFADLELSGLENPVGGERMEEFMDCYWGASAPGTFNVNHSIFGSFFKWQIRQGRMRSNPMDLVERARKRDVYRSTFSKDQHRAIIASSESLRDRIMLRLLLDYGIRKGALQKIQFKHFDHQRKRLTIFTKGMKVRTLPLPHPDFWMDLERHILDVEALPNHFLACLEKPVPRAGMVRKPERAMSSTALHRWWYRQLERAGVVPKGETSGERMHKARHTAGQRVLDSTGDLKLVQRFLGHASIQTTGDIYVDYDIEQIAARLAEAWAEEEDE